MEYIYDIYIYIYIYIRHRALGHQWSVSNALLGLPSCWIGKFFKGPAGPLVKLVAVPFSFLFFVLLLEPSKNHFLQSSAQSWPIFFSIWPPFWEPRAL